MKIIEIRKSLEPCTESGWDAVDVILEEELSEQDIRRIGTVGGSFLFLQKLRKPFFKIESGEYVIKGVLGDAFFRIAAHRDRIDSIQQQILEIAEL